LSHPGPVMNEWSYTYIPPIFLHRLDTENIPFTRSLSVRFFPVSVFQGFFHNKSTNIQNLPYSRPCKTDSHKILTQPLR